MELILRFVKQKKTSYIHIYMCVYIHTHTHTECPRRHLSYVRRIFLRLIEIVILKNLYSDIGVFDYTNAT
jgi:hypothetical protein